ncbi:hypothetical protein [Gilvimarinus xylanilyticus]|uniref:Uncharacterized protein n=1 Tax=Gilvimarinus xylanilyticus TaxID=2944139 RepID=A0A9X2KX51_9GAMM|nr:hypothetical protein [Gilvimarinus xylanilyticus]MCP8900810.1 hypothetical protein [Gilvimarinus xylanilyticus]
MKALLGCIIFAAINSHALADLKPDILDCNAQKAARNAALDSTVGVSGHCDAEKLADKAKDNAKDSVKEAKKEVGETIDNTKKDVADALPGDKHKHDNLPHKRD